MRKQTAGVWLVAVLGASVAWTETVTVPLEMSTGRPVVELTVGGHGPYRMVLDTGAGGSVVASDIAAALGLRVIGTDRLGDPSGRRTHEVDQVALAGARLGGIDLGELEAASLDLPEALGHGGRPFDGVLSVRALEGYLITLDLAAGELRLEAGAELALGTEGVAPYYVDHDIPWIHATVGPVTVRAFLDTGSPGQLSMSRDLAKHLELGSEPVVVAHAKTVSSSFEIATAPLVGDVTVAGHAISNPNVMFDGLHRGTQANLGSGFLRQFVITLDQVNHLLRFEPSGALPAPLPQRRVALDGAH